MSSLLTVHGVLWSMINGFCTGSLASFAIARAFAGIGAL